MRLPWVSKYSPKTTSEIIGHDEVVQEVRRFISEYKRGDKPLLLVGKSGVGKTSLVQAVANEFDRELLEVNASDTRNKASMESLLGPALQQQSLFYKGKIILIDEADSVSGVKDRGGNAALVKLTSNSSHPIILTANEIDSAKIKDLKKVSRMIELTPIPLNSMVEKLRLVADSEKILVEDSELTMIARRSGGDLRAAITDFQSLTTGDSVSKEDIELLSDREAKEEVIQALLRVFKTTSADVALPAFDAVDADPGVLLLWMDENIPREYTKEKDLARALDALADADRFFGRIRRWQYYRFYVYCYNLLSAGVALAKDEKYPGVCKYKRSDRPLKIWIYNRKNAKRKILAEKLAKATHTSKRQIIQDVLPYIKYKWNKDPAFAKELQERYELEDEIEWFSK